MKKALSIAALLVMSISGTAIAHGDFELAVKAPSAKSSSKAVAKVTVKPTGKMHINLEYPTKLTIKAPSGVTIEKAKQTSQDAAKFDEHAAEFNVAFTADSPGKKAFTGELKFALCDDAKTSCHPHVETVTFDVEVK